MPDPNLPLRWEGTGDQWWFASPIDWAAANGHFDVVRELLHIDPNLLINLTSLRRIRRLESVWDDDSRFIDVARCRASVARSLLSNCETRNGHNTLIKSGYGGWLLYTAASAGDMDFVQGLLKRDPLMVYGEGEFGITDILYAAARSKNSELFRLLLDLSLSPRCFGGARSETNDNVLIFRMEMMNRAVHAAARGGNWDVLNELLSGCRDVLAYRDVHGFTVLHAAAGRGQAEVVKNLVASFNVINSKDNQGNTSLHVAAFRGHLTVLEALIAASPSSLSLTNNMGDTFLHTAVAGFRTPGFQRLDRQMELMKQLVSGTMVNIEKIINCRNNDGRTVLHMAVIGNMHCDLISLLMSVRTINLNVQDTDGVTPLDLLNQLPRSASSELLIKQLISAGGMSNSTPRSKRLDTDPNLGLQGIIRSSPGTLFKISDAEIFLYTGIEASDVCADRGSGRRSLSSSISQSDLTQLDATEGNQTLGAMKKKHSPVRNAANRLKTLLRWPKKKDKKMSTAPVEMSRRRDDSNKVFTSLKIPGDDDFAGQMNICCPREDTPAPLRQRFSKTTSVQYRKLSSLPSPSSRMKFAAGLMQGVIQAMPHLAPQAKSTSNPSGTLMASSHNRSLCSDMETHDNSFPISSANDKSFRDPSQQSGSIDTRQMNRYFCFGAHGLGVEDSATRRHSN